MPGTQTAAGQELCRCRLSGASDWRLAGGPASSLVLVADHVLQRGPCINLYGNLTPVLLLPPALCRFLSPTTQHQPGFGSSTGTAPCRLCPPSTYSAGGTLEECLPCPFGYTSAPGAKGIESCVKVAMKCPAGQIAPSDAVSPDECACLPGYGGGEKPTDACRRCPPGTFAPGGTTEPW